MLSFFSEKPTQPTSSFSLVCCNLPDDSGVYFTGVVVNNSKGSGNSKLGNESKYKSQSNENCKIKKELKLRRWKVKKSLERVTFQKSCCILLLIFLALINYCTETNNISQVIYYILLPLELSEYILIMTLQSNPTPVRRRRNVRRSFLPTLSMIMMQNR